MCKQHNERQYQPLPQDLAESVARLVLCPHDHTGTYVFHRFAYDFRLFRKDCWCVSFSEEEERGDLNENCEYGCRKEDPTPASTGGDESTANRSYTGRSPSSHAVNGLA